MDHCLVWLSYNGLDMGRPAGGEEIPWRPTISVLLGGGKFAARDIWRASKGLLWRDSPARPKSPESVFLLAEYFCKGHVNGLPSGWELHTGLAKAVRLIPVDVPDKSRCKSSNAHLSTAVQLNASLAGPSGVTIRRLLPSAFSEPCGRLHFRARFQDLTAKGVGQSHWAGLQTRLGQGAVGLCHRFPQHYAFTHGDWNEWQQSSVRRSAGWHLFELIFEDGHVSIAIDGEPLSKAAAMGHGDAEVVCLTSERGSCGNWNSIEVLHTPVGRGTWDTGVQSVVPSDVWPWEVRSEEQGRWQVGPEGILHEMPATHVEEAVAEEEVAAVEDTIAEEEATVAEDAVIVAETVEVEETVEEEAEQSTLEAFNEVPPPPRVTSSRRRARPKRTRAGNSTQSVLSVVCWALPGETELGRLDRVVRVLLEKLGEAGMTVPSNFGRLDNCSEPQHESCFTYSFGSRRLHISTREGAGGRLTLVVRCGGGFLDFIEFVRRNGAMEQLKLERLQNAEGDGQQLKFTSVLTQGKRQVMNSTNNSTL